MRQQGLTNGRVMEGRTAETKKKKSLLFFLPLFLSVFLSLPRRLGEILCANNRLAPGLTSAFQAQRTRSCFTCHAINHPPSHVTPASPVFSFFFSFSHIPNVTHSLATLGRAARPHSTSLFCRRRRRLSAALLLLIAALGRVGPSVM